jgi:Tol biopolymer transport system component
VKTFLAVAILVLVLSSSAASGSLASTERVSISGAGAQGDRDSFAVGLSADARFVLVNSLATNLVPGDTNDRWDVFVFDRSTAAMQRVSVTSSGAEAKPSSDPFGGSIAGGISGNGRLVVFRSDAANLAAHDTNRVADVFVYDRAAHRVTRVSVSNKGRQANGPSGDPAISANGRYVAFWSTAANLVRGDTNGLSDVFVRDLRTHRTVRVSVTSRGRQAGCNAGGCESTEPALSANGRYVAFESSATNLVAGDTNRLADVFVRDLRTGRTQRVSISSSGRQAGGDRTNNGSNAPMISADGRYVVFHSYASNLVRGDTNRVPDIFLRDRKTRKTARISVSSSGLQADQESLGSAAVSADGRYVAFTSLATNLVAGDANDITDVFVRDLRAGTTTLVSLGAAGNQGDDASSAGGAVFSADDRYLAFSSWAGNLVAGDTNDKPDAFVRYLSVQP